MSSTTICIWTPYQENEPIIHGPRKKLKDLLKISNLNGSLFYGSLDEIQLDWISTKFEPEMERSSIWAFDCHNVWDDPNIQEPLKSTVIEEKGMEGFIISYVKFNGRLAKQAVECAMKSSMPIILVYRHADKAVVLDSLVKKGLNVLGLVDDRDVNLVPVQKLGLRAVHCLASKTVAEHFDEQLEKSKEYGFETIKGIEDIATFSW